MPNQLPLSQIRVLDLSRVFAMPYVGAYLADLGADVIKVDTHHIPFMDTSRASGFTGGPFPDNSPGELYWEQGGTFHTLNRGKRSLTLDLRSEAAQAIIRDLVRVSDVVLENFTPRVMARFGLDYANLRSAKPDLIMVSNTGYGHSGPWSNFGAMASSLEPTHGTGAFMGYLAEGPDGSRAPEDVPKKMGNSYTDFLATWTALTAIMAALFQRARSGRGMWVDLAMYQVGASFIGEGLLDYAYNGRRTRRMGNRHQSMAPHGCYPCSGKDEWVTLAVRDDADWEAIRDVVVRDCPEIADEKFSQALGRLTHQDELDRIVTGWTSSRGQYQVMEELQAVGVPAGPVLNARGLLADPHFRSRNFFEPVEHPAVTGLGRRDYIGRGWKMSANDLRIQAPAPLLGQDNDYLLREVLGLSAQHLDALVRDRVMGDVPEGASIPATVPLDEQVALGSIVEWDQDYESR
jgi:crotonobetainyl-CoA:carnitine CoA-transferase CaiB-like acyl-CoA transferase